MPSILFEAPGLYDPDAAPLDDPKGILHDAGGMLAPLGREKRFAFWVADRLRANKLKVLGPDADESGWAVQVNVEGGFVIFFLGYEEKKAAFSVLIHGFDADAAATTLFERFKEIVETTEGATVLKIDRDA